jgi:hypothetical protein
MVRGYGCGRKPFQPIYRLTPITPGETENYANLRPRFKPYTSCLKSRQLPQWTHAFELKDKQKRKEEG